MTAGPATSGGHGDRPTPSDGPLYIRCAGVKGSARGMVPKGSVRLKLRPDDLGFECDRAVHQPLNLAADALVAMPGLLADDVHPPARGHHLTEADLVGGAEADEALPAHEFAGVERS